MAEMAQRRLPARFHPQFLMEAAEVEEARPFFQQETAETAEMRLAMAMEEGVAEVALTPVELPELEALALQELW